MSEEKAFEENMTPEQKVFLRQERLVMLEMQKKIGADEMNWWNKLKNMSEYELKLLPYGFMKKYGSMLNFLRRMEKEAHVKENKAYKGYYDQVKEIDRLQHNDEKEAHRKYVELHQTPEVVKITDLVREEGDYFRR